MGVIRLPAGSAVLDHFHAAFLAAMPKILNVARYRFRCIRCSDRREDCISETIALCWVWYIRLIKKGRNPGEFMTALASYGAKAVTSGRRACGQEKANDVLSRRCQRQRRFAVAALPTKEHWPDHAADAAIADALHDNTSTPVPDQVQFRCDFPAWKDRLPFKKQRLIDSMALGHRSKDLAIEFRLTEGRISQLRKEFFEDYAAFCGDKADN